MNIFIQGLEMKNFKSHKTLKITFSDLVEISGKNGEGKSSIGEAITWNLFGTDTLGTLIDPIPIYEIKDEVSSTVYLQVDDKQLKLKRAIQNGKNVFYVNDKQIKSTDYKELIESLCSKDLFLSIFTPSYFSSQHWKEQREQLLQYVPEPLNREVLEKMSSTNKAILEDLLKEKSLSELDKQHRDRYKNCDKEIERAGAKMETLKEQLSKTFGSETTDLKDARSKLERLQTEIAKREIFNQNILAKEKRLEVVVKTEQHIREQIMLKKELVEALKSQHLPELCNECGQSLDYNAREQIRQNHEQRIESVKMEGKDLVHELEETLNLKKAIEIKKRVDISALYAEAEKYRHLLLDSERITQLELDIQAAEKCYEGIRKERNESLRIIEAIKEFVDKKASLMVDKVNDLFSIVTIKLFEKQKNEIIKQTFEIEMDGKTYQKLSTAERVRAGMELIGVLQEQSGVTSTTFIDNAESVLHLKLAPGQAIISTVKNHSLKIEGGILAS